MRLIDVLKQECITPGAAAATKTELLELIAETAKRSPTLRAVSTQDILDGLKTREDLGSTGFGQGIAIPHCRLDNVPDFVMGLVTVPEGVDFDALDNEKVKLAIFIIGPSGGTESHLKLLSAISHILLIPGVVEELLSVTTPELMYESFIRHTRADLDTTKRTTKAQVTVYILDKTQFRKVVEELNAIETSSVMIVDAERPGAYLKDVPLFADFWRDKQESFCKVIHVIVEKGLVNECIRRVGLVVGDLDNAQGVMVTVQEMTSVMGAL